MFIHYTTTKTTLRGRVVHKMTDAMRPKSVFGTPSLSKRH